MKRCYSAQRVSSHLISECNLTELHSNVKVTVKFLAFRSDKPAYLQGHYPNDAVYIYTADNACSFTPVNGLVRAIPRSLGFFFHHFNVGPGAPYGALIFHVFLASVHRMVMNTCKDPINLNPHHPQM